MIKKTDLAEFKQRLLILYARMRGDIEQLTAEALDQSGGNGDPRSPTHLAELGSANYEQDFSLRVVESDQEVLQEIRAALRRVEDGTYGTCEMCLAEGKPPSKAAIPKRRLQALPYARNCVACERKREELSL